LRKTFRQVVCPDQNLGIQKISAVHRPSRKSSAC
jgi:hypothetical protein